MYSRVVDRTKRRMGGGRNHRERRKEETIGGGTRGRWREKGEMGERGGAVKKMEGKGKIGRQEMDWYERGEGRVERDSTEERGEVERKQGRRG